MRGQKQVHRFFVPDLTAQPSGGIELSRDEAGHAVRVLRLKVGSDVELFDGCGALAEGRIVEITRRSACVETGEITRLDRSGAIVNLAFAVPKGKRLDWLLEKAAELGAASLQPVVFERSVAGRKKLSDAALSRWNSHCVAAAKQCGLNFLPRINQPVEFDAMLENSKDSLSLLGDLSDAARPLAEVLDSRRRASEICIMVGPEGDLTPSERQKALEVGFIPVRLGHTTLRVETAAIALLAAVMALYE